jgi:hypothetical protein
MGANEAGTIVGMIIGGLIGLAVGSLISAILLRAAAHWMKKIDIPFGSAYGTMFSAGLVNMVIAFVLGLAVGAVSGGKPGSLLGLQVALFLISFLIQAAFISSRHAMSFSDAILIEAGMFLIALAIGLILGIVVFAIFFGMGMLMHAH